MGERLTGHEPQIHVLKTLGRYFDAVERGDKTFEVRLNDRAFQTGDILELVRIDDDRKFTTGAKLRRRVSYLLQGGQFGIEPAYCILGLGDAP